MATDRIVYFGDSLTDGGTIFGLTAQVLETPVPFAAAGYQGVFSDGQVYSQIAPQLLGISTVENFAAGAARAVGSQALSELIARNGLDPLLVADADPAVLGTDINLGGQVGRFLGQEAVSPFAGSTTASILIGLNDIAGFAPSGTVDPVVEATELLTNIVTATLGSAQALAVQGGVDKVVLYTFPATGFFPFSQFVDPALVPLGDLLIAEHANAINAGAAQLNAVGIETEVISLGEMTAEISADAATFGFLALEQSVLFGSATDPVIIDGPDGPEFFFPVNPAVAGLDPDQIAFFDLLHPTTALHGVIGSYSAAVLSMEDSFLTDANDRFRGSSAEDFVLAKAGNDKLFLNGGDDIAFGGLGNDLIKGGRGADILAGGSGDDRVFGGRDGDVLAGGAGDDLLSGGAGDDALIDGLGSDIAFGGRGDDAFFYTDGALIGGETGADRDKFFGGWGYDTLYLAVSEEVRAGVEAEIEGGGCWGVHYFHDLNLLTVGIEKFVMVDSRVDLGNQVVPDGLQDVFDEANLWGLL